MPSSLCYRRVHFRHFPDCVACVLPAPHPLGHRAGAASVRAIEICPGAVVDLPPDRAAWRARRRAAATTHRPVGRPVAPGAIAVMTLRNEQNVRPTPQTAHIADSARLGVALVAWAGGCRSSGSGRLWRARRACRAAPGRGQHASGRLAGQRGGRVAPRLRHLARRRADAGQARQPVQAGTAASRCPLSPADGPGADRLTAGKPMAGEVPPRGAGRRLPVAEDHRPALPVSSSSGSAAAVSVRLDAW